MPLCYFGIIPARRSVKVNLDPGDCQLSGRRSAAYPEKGLSSIIEREFLMPKKPSYEELEQRVREVRERSR